MLSRRDFIKTVELVSAAACFAMPQMVHAESQAPTNEAKRPNIILFTADDLGMELGCYGDNFVRTPHLDSLAAVGTRFTTAYVTQASCSPSRSSMLTGLYPHQNGQIGLAHSYTMNKVYPSIPTLLKQSGYKTSIFGKLHISLPESFDFDFECLDGQMNVQDRDVKQLSAIAENFMTEAGEQPFFMMFNAIDPHRPLVHQRLGLPESPLTADEVSALPFLGMDNEVLRETTAAYYNSIARVDYAMGAIVASLHKIGKFDNTLIIVIGDHGAPFTRAKTTCYEAGLRIPFIVTYGKNLPRGCVRSELISTVDIMPTILEAAGVEAPANLPGKSIISLLKKDIQWRQYLCGEYTSHGKKHYFPRRAIRDKRYKLIRNYLAANPLSGVDGCTAYTLAMKTPDLPEHIMNAYKTYKSPTEYEFYDLGVDPYEFRNLIDTPAYQPQIERLKKALEDWQNQTGDDNPHCLNETD